MSFLIETAKREGAKTERGGLTQERLKEVLSYDEETGVFVWLKSLSNRSPVGSVAGTCRKDYVRISIDGEIYLAHRLAWLYVTGSPAIGDIDHINRNTKYNAFKNLRNCSRAENLANQGLRTNNSTGVKGVYFCPTVKGPNKWEAKIMSCGVNIYGGRHSSKELALAAANRLRESHHGEFSREK